MAKSKSEYWLTKDGLILLEGWARDGLTDEQIAHNMGIRRETLYDYKNKFPNISNALKKGKEVIDFEVENALLKRALGYEYQEETYETTYDREKDQYVERLTKRVTKQMPPDSTSLIYWLKNRKPKEWRDKIEIDKTSNVSRIQIINDLPEDDEDGEN